MSVKNKDYYTIWIHSSGFRGIKRLKIHKRALVSFLVSSTVSLMLTVSFLGSRLPIQQDYISNISYNNFMASHQVYRELKSQLSGRLSELGAVLKSAGDLGVISQRKLEALDLGDINSIGGLDYECEGEACVQKVVLSPSVLSTNQLIEKTKAYEQLFKKLPLNFPLKSGRMTSPFGNRKSPFSSGWKMHRGVDIGAKYGTEVYSSSHGKVINVEYHATYGKVVDIRHNKDVVTRYAHLSHVNVKEGQRVTAETVIGKVGATGRATGPHLHYEIIVNNKPLNPQHLISLGSLAQKLL